MRQASGRLSLEGDAAASVWDREGEVHAAYEAAYARLAPEARRRAGAAWSPPNGGALMFALMLFDVASTAAIVGAAALFVGCHGYGPAQWIFWYALEVAKIGAALAGLPFALISMLPLDAISGARATGYDRHGWLCRQLSLPEIRLFREQRDKLRADARAADAPRGGLLPGFMTRPFGYKKMDTIGEP